MNRMDEYTALLAELEQTPEALNDTVSKALDRKNALQKKRRILRTSFGGFAACFAAVVLLVNLFPPFARACGSVPVLRELAQAVDREVVRQTGYLERSEIMEESLRDFGCAIVCDSLERCVELANEIAPEHLEIMTEEPRALLPLVKNAGAVFLGAYTPEPLGDYLAGPDHVLPTSGTARFSSPLGVDDFVKKSSFLYYTREALGEVAPRIADFAEREGLHAHARSVTIRYE